MKVSQFKQTTGTNADETLIGTSRPDLINGNGGNDKLDGTGVGDILYGVIGDDRTGADIMHGGAGDDLYRVDSIADMVSKQTIDISNPSQVESLNLHIGRAVGATSGTAFSIAARSAVGSLNGEILPGFSPKPAGLARLVAVHCLHAGFDR